MHKAFVFFVIAITLLSSVYSVFAQDQNTQAIEVKYEKINPSNGFDYALKRLKEKIYLTLLFYSKDKKAGYYNKLVTRRLAELKYVVEQKDMANFENATTRYSTTVGMWVEYINQKNLVDQEEPASQLLVQHSPVVERLMEKYDPTTAEWRFVKQDLDYLQIYIDKLQK